MVNIMRWRERYIDPWGGERDRYRNRRRLRYRHFVGERFRDIETGGGETQRLMGRDSERRETQIY